MLRHFTTEACRRRTKDKTRIIKATRAYTELRNGSKLPAFHFLIACSLENRKGETQVNYLLVNIDVQFRRFRVSAMACDCNESGGIVRKKYKNLVLSLSSSLVEAGLT